MYLYSKSKNLNLKIAIDAQNIHKKILCALSNWLLDYGWWPTVCGKLKCIAIVWFFLIWIKRGYFYVANSSYNDWGIVYLLWK